MTKVALIGPNGNPTPKCYKIIEEKQDKNTTIVRVKDTRTNQIIRIPKSRILVKESDMSLKCGTCGKEMNSKSGLTLHQKKCGGTTPSPSTTKKPPLKLVKKKKKTAPASTDAFDIAGFRKEHGGELWTKAVKFDHPVKAISHQILDEKTGYYYSFNTYNGSLGKSAKGVTKYPLKGKTLTYTVSDNTEKKDSRGNKRIRKGKKTADQVRKLWQKNGYKKK